jgi:hypothetical protein
MDQYKYISIAEAYRSIYAKPANHEDKRAATQYAEKRDEKMKERQKATLKVEAADLAYVLNALIEDGTVTSERVKDIMREKLETGAEYHARMREKNKEPINKFPVKNKDGKETVRRNVSPVKRKPDTRTDAQKMADAYASPRKGPGGATRAD